MTLSLKVDPFDPLYTLEHLSSKPTSHLIQDLKPYDKNIELKIIILEKKQDYINKKSQTTVTSFLVADQTGSINLNFYSDCGRDVSMIVLREENFRKTTFCICQRNRAISEFFYSYKPIDSSRSGLYPFKSLTINTLIF